MPPKINVVGFVYGRLTILERDGERCICKCECGNTKDVPISSLRNGGTRSCGCLHRESGSKPPGQVSFVHLWTRCKFNARKRGIEFDMSLDRFKEIVVNDCVYCGDPPRAFNVYFRFEEKSPRRPGRNHEETLRRAWINAHGVDRINSSIGYVEGNIVCACRWCNTAKNDRSVEDFIAQSRKIIAYQDLKEFKND